MANFISFIVNLGLALLVGFEWHTGNQHVAIAMICILILNQTDRIINRLEQKVDSK